MEAKIDKMMQDISDMKSQIARIDERTSVMGLLIKNVKDNSIKIEKSKVWVFLTLFTFAGFLTTIIINVIRMIN